MKKIFSIFTLAAATAAIFSACNKEAVTPIEGQEQVFTFAIGSDATKSILGSDENGRFVQFDADDKLGSIAPNAQGYSTVHPATDTDPATFEIYTKGAVAGDVLTVWYPYRTKQADASAVELTIPAAQSHKSGNAFDMKAMPMVARQITVTSAMVEASTTTNTPVATINFANLGSLINFKVFSTNADYAAEKVQSITFDAKDAQATAEANIGGSFVKNLAEIDLDDENSLAINEFSEGVSSITTTPVAAAEIGATKETALDLYMIVAPGSYTGTIVVETDAATYTYNLASAKTFVRSGVKAFGLDLNSETATRVAKETPAPADGTDVLTYAWTGLSGSGYTSFSGVSGSASSAVYAGEVYVSDTQTALQMRTTGSSSGIVTTTSGGTLASITVKWASNTADARTLDVYVKNTAYSAASDLFSSSAQGTLVHSFTKSDGDATYEFEGEYEFIGVRSASGALYVDEIDIEWSNTTWVLSGIEVTTAPDKTVYEAGEDFDPTGMVVKANYVDEEDPTHTKQTTIANENLTFDPSENLTAGTSSVTISYEGQTTTQEITVTAPKVWNLVSIAVTTAPDKTTYTEGQYFDPTGMVVTATYEEEGNTSNTKTEEIALSELSFLPDEETALTTTDDVVYIFYGEFDTQVEITVNEASTSEPVTYTSTFTSKDWATASGEPQWTSGKGGNALTSGRGIQVTAGASGANATTTTSFSNVSSVVVTYSTNASKGAGTIAIQVGSAAAQSQAVTTSGGTTDRTLTFTPDASGAVKITVTCTTNSIYIKSIDIVADAQ